MTTPPATLLAPFLLDLTALLDRPALLDHPTRDGATGPGGAEGAVLTLLRERVPGVVSASLTRRAGTRPATSAASDPVAEHADRIQYETGQGPCLHALAAGHAVRIGIAGTDDPRWPEFRRRARAETAIGSVLSHPVPDTTPVSLNVYLAAPEPADDVAPAAAAAAVVLAAASARARAEQLHEALDSSRTIGAAIGILMVRNGLTQDAAFAALREVSQRQNRKLRAVAAEIVANRTG